MRKIISRLSKAIGLTLCTLFLMTGGFKMLTCQAQGSDEPEALPQTLIDSYYTGQDTAVYKDFRSQSSQGLLNSTIAGEADSFLNPVWDYSSFTKVRVLDQNLTELQQDGALYTCVFTENHKNGYVILSDNPNESYPYAMEINTPDLDDLRADMSNISESLVNANIDLSTAKASRVMIQDKEKQTAAQAILFTDGKGNHYVYYFNHPASQDNNSQESLKLSETYLGFLNGTIPAVTADWYNPDDDYDGLGKLEKGKAYTLKQMEDTVISDIRNKKNQASPALWREKWEKDTEYALIDSENNGEPELAVRLNHVGIDSLGDDDTSTSVLILKESGGKLLLCDAFNTWSRSDTTQYYYGFRDSGGSNGADDYSGDISFLDKNGKRNLLCATRTSGEDWIAGINQKAYDNYNKIYNNVYPQVFQIEVDTMGGKNYYSYYAEYSEDKQQETKEQKMVQTMISCFNNQGISFSTPEELQKAYDGEKQKLGINEDWCQSKELDWHKVSELHL